MKNIKKQDYELSFKLICTILFLSIILNLVLAYKIIENETSNENRLHRIESLMNYTTFYYENPIVFGINENFTIRDVKSFYRAPHYTTYKTMAAYVMLDYVCDGKNQEIIETMLK